MKKLFTIIALSGLISLPARRTRKNYCWKVLDGFLELVSDLGKL